VSGARGQHAQSRQSDDEGEGGTENGLVGAPRGKEREGREGFVGWAATQCTLFALFVREAAGTLRGRGAAASSKATQRRCEGMQLQQARGTQR
jgi:hypothetical protein